MSDGRPDQYILFLVAGTTYALPSHNVAHVEMIEHVTRVPNAPAFVDGVVLSRGQVVPAVNMRIRFGFDRIDAGMKARLLVTQSRDRRVGLLVDECREFLAIAAAAIQPPGEAVSAVAARYVAGIATLGQRLIVVLNLDELLDSAEPILAA